MPRFHPFALHLDLRSLGTLPCTAAPCLDISPLLSRFYSYTPPLH